MAKAGQIGADAIIVDLEDSVPSAVKPAARETLAAAIATLRQAGAVVAVRINAPWREALADLDAAVIIGLEAIVVPKAEHAEYLAVIGEMIGEFEAARGLPARAIGVVALVESPAGLANAAALATAPRIVGLALGSEDFALSLGVPPSPAVLALPVQQIALAAAAAGVMALGRSHLHRIVPAAETPAVGQPRRRGPSALPAPCAFTPTRWRLPTPLSVPRRLRCCRHGPSSTPGSRPVGRSPGSSCTTVR